MKHTGRKLSLHGQVPVNAPRGFATHVQIYFHRMEFSTSSSASAHITLANVSEMCLYHCIEQHQAFSLGSSMLSANSILWERKSGLASARAQLAITGRIS